MLVKRGTTQIYAYQKQSPYYFTLFFSKFNKLRTAASTPNRNQNKL